MSIEKAWGYCRTCTYKKSFRVHLPVFGSVTQTGQKVKCRRQYATDSRRAASFEPSLSHLSAISLAICVPFDRPWSTVLSTEGSVININDFKYPIKYQAVHGAAEAGMAEKRRTALNSTYQIWEIQFIQAFPETNRFSANPSSEPAFDIHACLHLFTSLLWFIESIIASHPSSP